MRFKDKVWNILNTVLYVLFVISALTSTIGILLLLWGASSDDGAWQLVVSGLLLLFVSGLWLAVNQAIETKNWIKTHCRKEG
jgi:hypothetical protein